MSAVNDILKQIPLDQFASELGTDPDTAQQVAQQAVTSLLGGMQNNVADPSKAASLAGALEQHADSPLANESQINLNQVDTHDGQKIANHVFGAAGVPQSGSTSSQLLSKAIKILAPIVLAYLAKKLGSGDYGNVLGQILGGANQATQRDTAQSDRHADGHTDGQAGGQSNQASAGAVLGQVLGSLLGR